LLVEDSAQDEALTLRQLQAVSDDTDIAVAGDGEKALAFILDRIGDGEEPVQKLPDLVILDLKLPKIDGHDVLRELRANRHTRNIPVVVFSSSDEERDIARSYELGANSYVQKPVNFEDFKRTMATLGKYWVSMNLSPRS